MKSKILFLAALLAVFASGSDSFQSYDKDDNQATVKNMDYDGNGDGDYDVDYDNYGQKIQQTLPESSDIPFKTRFNYHHEEQHKPTFTKVVIKHQDSYGSVNPPIDNTNPADTYTDTAFVPENSDYDYYSDGFDEPTIKIQVPILKQIYKSDFRGNYDSQFHSGDDTFRVDAGQVKINSNGHSIHTKSGSVLWRSPEGIPFELKYTADENGFHPFGDHLPTPPPTPQAILEMLQRLPKLPKEFIPKNNPSSSSSSSSYYSPASYNSQQSYDLDYDYDHGHHQESYGTEVGQNLNENQEQEQEQEQVPEEVESFPPFQPSTFFPLPMKPPMMNNILEIITATQKPILVPTSASFIPNEVFGSPLVEATVVPILFGPPSPPLGTSISSSSSSSSLPSGVRADSNRFRFAAGNQPGLGRRPLVVSRP